MHSNNKSNFTYDGRTKLNYQNPTKHGKPSPHMGGLTSNQWSKPQTQYHPYQNQAESGGSEKNFQQPLGSSYSEYLMNEILVELADLQHATGLVKNVVQSNCNFVCFILQG